ncbi:MULTISPECIES: class I SAM-dependent methyltransferase [Thermomonosporaceae]|uniref:class I SAM-dependent methyltransferase n=1 Tax=Thermomonosporaceae TaxID=2012 RepID=UPI00255AEB6C|nr:MULTISPECIES: class I SAM-dependent methyltransferase [Thermomonosporaceae]MDL4776685.1 class I SAM-dependent methyltransferase [Actinomadura xylanilytica]
MTAGDGHAVFLAFLGDPRGLRVLDLGCAAPEAGRSALDRGAAAYLGLAVGERSLDAARHALAGTAGEARAQDLHRWSGHDLGTFDAVISWMTFHRVRNLARLLETVHHHLVPGGRLVFSVPHPFVTASPDGKGDLGGGGVSGYFSEGERPAPDGGRDDTPGETAIWHRTLEGYLYELRCCGFHLEELSEGRPAPGAPATARRPDPDVPRHVSFRCRRRA